MTDESVVPAAVEEQAAAAPPRLRLEDLRPGMLLTGRVVNIAKFGAFVDIGVGQDGLVHISELSDERVRRVEDVVQRGQTVEVTVLDVDQARKRISLSMRAVETEAFLREPDDEPGPTIMELAFQRAQAAKERRRAGSGESGGAGRSQRQREQEDILARTLKYHRENRK